MSYVALFPNGESAKHHITLCHVETTPDSLNMLQEVVDKNQEAIEDLLPTWCDVIRHMRFGARMVAIVERTPDLIALREIFEHLDKRSWTPHVTEQNGILWGVGVTMAFFRLEAR